MDEEDDSFHSAASLLDLCLDSIIKNVDQFSPGSISVLPYDLVQLLWDRFCQQSGEEIPSPAACERLINSEVGVDWTHIRPDSISAEHFDMLARFPDLVEVKLPPLFVKFNYFTIRDPRTVGDEEQTLFERAEEQEALRNSYSQYLDVTEYNENEQSLAEEWIKLRTALLHFVQAYNHLDQFDIRSILPPGEQGIVAREYVEQVLDTISRKEPQITRLDLSILPFLPASQLKSTLGRLTTLQQLNLDGCFNLTDECFRQAVANNSTTLQELYVKGCVELHSGSITYAISHLSQLRTLSLGNHLELDDAALSRLHTLPHLHTFLFASKECIRFKPELLPKRLHSNTITTLELDHMHAVHNLHTEQLFCLFSLLPQLHTLRLCETSAKLLCAFLSKSVIKAAYPVKSNSTGKSKSRNKSKRKQTAAVVPPAPVYPQYPHVRQLKTLHLRGFSPLQLDEMRAVLLQFDALEHLSMSFCDLPAESYGLVSPTMLHMKEICLDNVRGDVTTLVLAPALQHSTQFESLQVSSDEKNTIELYNFNIQLLLPQLNTLKSIRIHPGEDWQFSDETALIQILTKVPGAIHSLTHFFQPTSLNQLLQLVLSSEPFLTHYYPHSHLVRPFRTVYPSGSSIVFFHHLFTSCPWLTHVYLYRINPYMPHTTILEVESEVLLDLVALDPTDIHLPKLQVLAIDANPSIGLLDWVFSFAPNLEHLHLTRAQGNTAPLPAMFPHLNQLLSDLTARAARRASTPPLCLHFTMNQHHVFNLNTSDWVQTPRRFNIRFHTHEWRFYLDQPNDAAFDHLFELEHELRFIPMTADDESQNPDQQQEMEQKVHKQQHQQESEL